MFPLMKVLYFLLLTLLSLNATAMVVGQDTRVPLKQFGAIYPLNTVGTVTTDSGSACTGTLVAKNVVMTGRHCVEGAGSVTFQLPGQQAMEVIHISLGENRPHRLVNDFAFLRLSQDSKIWSGTGPHRAIGAKLVGHDSGLGVELFVNTVDCQIQQTNDGGMLIHDCPTGQVSSGAPLFQRHVSGEIVIVGINIAEGRPGSCDSMNLARKCFNVAVPLEQFYEPLQEFIRASN